MSDLDPQVMKWIDQGGQTAVAEPETDGAGLDKDVLSAVDFAEKHDKARKDYLRDRYAYGLVSPLKGQRSEYAERVVKEVTDPTERQWLVGEVGKIARMHDAIQRKEYNETEGVTGYAKRFHTNIQKVGGSFIDAGTGMMEAVDGWLDRLHGKERSAEDVQFLRALEGAKQEENPMVASDAPLTLKAATGAAGMTPDMAAGLLANAAGGPAAMAGYWTARLAPERREDYIEMGLDPEVASVAGIATAVPEAAVELINIDPTGLTKPLAAPVKGAVRQGLKKVAGKVGGKALKSFAKHPVSRRIVGAGIDAAKRVGLEAVEEGLQGAVQEGGKVLASRMSDKIEDRDLADVPRAAYEQTKESIAPLAVLGGTGAVMQSKNAVDRYKRFSKGAKQSRIETEIMEHAAADRIPSRKQWKAWNLPAEEGRTGKQRREAAKQMAAGFRSLDQARTILNEETPTERQWKAWGLPAEEGKTPESRRAYWQRWVEDRQQEAMQNRDQARRRAQGEVLSSEFEPAAKPAEPAAKPAAKPAAELEPLPAEQVRETTRKGDIVTLSTGERVIVEDVTQDGDEVGYAVRAEDDTTFPVDPERIKENLSAANRRVPHPPMPKQAEEPAAKVAEKPPVAPETATESEVESEATIEPEAAEEPAQTPAAALQQYEREQGYDKIIRGGLKGSATAQNKALLESRRQDARWRELKEAVQQGQRPAKKSFRKRPAADTMTQQPEESAGSAGKPIVVRGDEFGEGKPADIRKRAIQWAKENLLYTTENGRKFANKETGRQIAVTSSGIRHTAKMGRIRELFASMTKIPELIESARFVRTEADSKNRPGVQGMDVYEAPLSVGGRDFTATLFVSRMADGLELDNILYHHKLQKKKGLTRPKALDSKESGPVPVGEPSQENPTPTPPKVKRSIKRRPETGSDALKDTDAMAAVRLQGQDMAVEIEGTGQRVGGREVVRDLEEIWGIPLRHGRMGTKARGIYKRRSQVARLARGEESSPAVVAHEVAHHLDRTTDVRKGLSQAARNELAALDYDQRTKRSSEGFAEYVRAMVTGSTARLTDVDLADVAPEFTKHFNGWLDSNPQWKKKIDATRAAIEPWQKAGSVGRVKGQVSKTGKDERNRPAVRERVNEYAHRLYTLLKDEGHAVSQFTKAAKRQGYDPKKDTTPYEDYNELRKVGGHYAATSIEDGVFRISDMKEIGPSLSEVLKDIGDDADYENFVTWAYARHALESWSKGKNPGISRVDAQETMRRLHDKRYEEAADKLTEFNNSLIVMLADSKVISAEEAKTIIGYYKTYIPLHRAKEGAYAAGGGRKMVNLSSAVKGRHGSGLQIIDPVEATIERAVRLYDRAAKQRAVNKLIEAAESTEGLGEWAERVPPKLLKTEFSLDDIQGQLAATIEEAGLDPDEILSELNPETALAIWKPEGLMIGGQPIARVSVDGQTRYYQFASELFEAFGGLSYQQDLDMVTGIVKHFTAATKFGATRANPSFWLTNAVRDYQTFLMQGEKGLKGAADPPKWGAAYVASEMSRAAGGEGDPVVRMWQKLGGELSTYTGLDRNRVKRSLSRARAGKQGWGATALNVVSTSEQACRIAEFAAILEKEGWLERLQQGEMPPRAVLTRAINAAHDVTVDFRRMGKWGRYLNHWIPFFNAQLEGLDKTVRTFKEKPVRTALRIAIQRLPHALLYWWYRHDDDDYKERPEWQDGYWIFTDGDGNPMCRIARPYEWGLFDAGIERMMDAAYEKDPEAITRWFRQALRTTTPNMYPGGITPLLETAFNYDTFRERPVVSRQLQKRQAPDQAYEHTSDLAKCAARFMHDYSGGKVSLSPAKLDHLAGGLSGGMYRRVTEPVSKAVQGGEWTASDIPGLKGVTLRKDYAKSVDDFYRTRDAVSQAHESARLRNNEGGDDRQWRRLEGVASLMSEMRDAGRNLPKEDGDRVERAMVGLARAALDREPLKRYPNPIANPESLPAAVQKVVRDHIAKKAISASRGEKRNDVAENAVAYLQELGVEEAYAKRLAYQRLRSQGLKAATARQRVDRLGKRLP